MFNQASEKLVFSSTKEQGLGSLTDIFTKDFLPAKMRSDFFFFF